MFPGTNSSLRAMLGGVSPRWFQILSGWQYQPRSILPCSWVLSVHRNSFSSLLGFVWLFLLHSLVMVAPLSPAQVLGHSRIHLSLPVFLEEVQVELAVYSVPLCPSALARLTVSRPFHTHLVCSKPKLSLKGQLQRKRWNQVWVLPRDSLKVWSTVELLEQFTMISGGFLICF